MLYTIDGLINILDHNCVYYWFKLTIHKAMISLRNPTGSLSRLVMTIRVCKLILCSR